MNKEYLQSFNDDQLEHYLKTLKRRVMDLRQLTIQLGKENQQLGIQYESLTKQKFEVFNKIQKKKKGWGSWLNLGKQKLTNILHISKKQQKKSEVQQELAQQATLAEEAPNQVQQESIQPQIIQSNESPSKKMTLQNFNFDDLYYLGKEKITNLFKKNKEGYHPSDRDNNQIQNGKKQEGIRENVELIREITGDHYQFKSSVHTEQSVEERQLQRKLLVEAEVAKKANQSLHTSAQQKYVVDSHLSEQNSVRNHSQLKQKQDQTHPEQNLHEEDAKEHQVDNLEASEEDQQFGVHFQSQMNEYQLKEQNVSQIVERQAQKAPQSQEYIEDSSTPTQHLQPKEVKNQESS